VLGLSFFFHKNFPQLQLPSRKTLSAQGLDDVYEMVRAKVIEDLRGVKVLCAMFDGWSDNNGFPYMGLRVAYISSVWESKVVTLSCKMLQGHTAINVSNHVRKEIDAFVDGGMRNIRLFTTHDAAANMVKASKLLKSEEFVHCVAHALHLLLVTDGMSKCEEIQALLERCSNIVQKLHFKGCELQDCRVSVYKDIPALDELLNKIASVKEILALEDSDPVTDDVEDEVDLVMDDLATQRERGNKTLKKPIVTRWNSALHMLRSIADNFDAVDQVLLRTGLTQLKLSEDDKELIKSIRDFLAPFEEYTQLVSAGGSPLSLAVLIRKDIVKKTAIVGPIRSSLDELKVNIAKNVDRRLKVTHSVLMATVMDPSTKNIAGSLITEEQLKPFYDQLSTGPGLYCLLLAMEGGSYLEV